MAKNFNIKRETNTMDLTKFNSEVDTLQKFFETFCQDKHENQKSSQTLLKFKKNERKVDLHLCEECTKNLNYSFKRLEECPHDIKPRCRTCPTPCYEKKQWAKTAKVMKYTGMKLGMTKIKSKFKKLFGAS